MKKIFEEVFFTVSRDGEKLFDLSSNYERIWGDKCKRLKQQPNSWLESVHPEEKERVSLAWNKLLKEQKPFQEKYRIASDRSNSWIYTRSFPLRQAEELAGYALVSTKIENRDDIIADSLAKTRQLIKDTLENIKSSDKQKDLIEKTLLNLSSYFPNLAIAYHNNAKNQNKITIIKANAAAEKKNLAEKTLNLNLVPEYWKSCQKSSFVAITDLTKDYRLIALKEKMLGMGMRGLLTVPLKYSGKILGLLTFFSSKPYNWQPKEIDNLVDLANCLSIGIQNLKTEAALARSQALQSKGDRIWEWNIQSDRIFSAAIGDFKPREESIEQWRGRIHPEDYSDVITAFENHLAGKSPFVLQYRVCDRNGNYKWILNRGQAQWDEFGRATRAIGIESDLDCCTEIIAELKENEKRYRRIVETMTEGVAIFNEKSQLIFVNQQLADILDCTVAELLKTNPYDFVDKKDIPELLKKREGRRNGQKERFDFRFRRKSGSQFWATISTNPILDLNGEYCGNLITVTDISDRKQAEVKIAQTEEFLSTLIDRLPLCLFVKDRAGRYITINRTSEQFFGCDKSKVLGKTDYDLFPKKQADFLRAKDLEVFKNDIEVQVPAEVLDSPNLGRRILRTTKLPLFDAEGNPEYLMGIAEDITDRQKIQLALEESEKQYRRIIETMSEGVWVLDAEGVTEFVNQQMAEMLGYEQSEMIDKHLLQFMDREGKADAIAKLQRRRQGIAEKHDFKFCRRNGKDLWAIVSTNPIFDDEGEYQGALGIITDITARKENEDRLNLALEAGNIICWEANLLTNRVSGHGWIETEWVNDSWEFSTKELFTKIFTSRERKYCRKIIARAIASQNQFILEHCCPLSSGKWFMMKGKVIRDQTGLATSIVGISVDITERKLAEIQIQQTDEFLHTLINSLPVALFVKDARPENFGQLVLLNHNSERLLGLTTAQAMDRTCKELFSKEQVEFFDFGDREAFANKTKIDIPAIAIETQNLGQRVLQGTKVPLYDREDRPQYLLCIAEDVSDRHRAKIALEESQARLAGILDNAEDGIISINADRRITLFNKGAEKIFGYSTSEIIDRPLELLIPERFYPAHDLHITEFGRSGEIAREMGERGAVFARRQDGTEFPVEVSISKLKLEKSTIFTAIIRDITERKLAEKTLREHKQFLESIFESAAEIIWVAERTEDGDFCILTINQSVEKFTGIPPQKWIGKRIDEVYRDPQIAAKFRSNYNICSQKETSITFEYDCAISKRCFLTTMSLLKTSDTSNSDRVRILAVAVDISDRKKAEKTLLELEKQRELSQVQLRFFSMASHEFRTPLSTILVIVQSLISYLDKLPREKIIKKLYQLEKVSKRMTEIIDHILKINRAETENLTIETQLLNPEKMCFSIVNEMQINAGKDRQIIFMSQGDTKLTRINPKLFNYILTNLLINAIKYSPDGSKIHLILRAEANKIVIIVKDRGIGIPKSDLPQLFQAFHRGTNIDNTPGSGLGLTLVKKCVDLQGGTIDVKSNLGKGTMFIVTIPTAND